MLIGRAVYIPLLVVIVVSGACGAAPTEPSELSLAIQAYQEDRLMTALGHFIHVLEKDPANDEAHAYMHLIIHKLEERQARKNREEGLEILRATSQLLQDRHEDSRVEDAALERTLAMDAARKAADAHSKCTEAQMEAQLGRLCVASDLVLQVRTQDERNEEAIQVWTDVQSQIQQQLASKKDLPLSERHALEGFYAYGQADYTSAVAAWGQARSALEQSSSTETAHQAALLRFEPYDQIARKHVDEERAAANARTLFSDGLAAFEQHDFDQALEKFRQVALLNQDYPQLGAYLVQSEAAVERKRTSDMSEAKRQEVAQAFALGMTSLEKGEYPKAKASFEAVLALDPAHPQAKLYLNQIETQKSRQSDPAAGQQHYEAGLIAFVSGDMEQAIREWHIALRFDPENPKVLSAINRAQRELNSSKDLLQG